MVGLAFAGIGVYLGLVYGLGKGGVNGVTLVRGSLFQFGELAMDRSGYDSQGS